jgi:hypothetical protein
MACHYTAAGENKCPGQISRSVFLVLIKEQQLLVGSLSQHGHGTGWGLRGCPQGSQRPHTALLLLLLLLLLRVRGEIMGSQNYRNVGESQSVLMMMIDPMISPRTRTTRRTRVQSSAGTCFSVASQTLRTSSIVSRRSSRACLAAASGDSSAAAWTRPSFASCMSETTAF